jgi:UDP-N-acetylglucosamine 3-dehydrogenase
MTLRVAIIGAGRIAELGHLPGFAQAGAHVVALCSQSSPNLKALADRFGVRHIGYDWRAMLDEGGFDAVSICTPPAFHAQIAVESLRRVYATLVEKPMAMTLDECDQIIEAARTSSRFLMVAHNQRFSPRHRLAKRLLDAGHLGKPQMAYAIFGHRGPEYWSPDQKWYFDPEKAGFGAMGDLGSHKIDLLRWLLGQEVSAISALTATFQKASLLDDTTVASLRFSGGTLANVQVSWALPLGVEDGVTIYCERGVLRIPGDMAQPIHTLEWRADGQEVETSHSFESDDPAGWLGMIAAFVQAVERGEPSPVSGEEGRATMQAVLAAYESASQKILIRLNH